LPISVRTPFFQAATNRTGVPYRPRGWVQTPEYVAERIAGCLRRPHPEIHTNRLTHLSFVFDTAFPSLADWLMARHYARRARSDFGRWARGSQRSWNSALSGLGP